MSQGDGAADVNSLACGASVAATHKPRRVLLAHRDSHKHQGRPQAQRRGCRTSSFCTPHPTSCALKGSLPVSCSSALFSSFLFLVFFLVVFNDLHEPIAYSLHHFSIDYLDSDGVAARRTSRRDIRGTGHAKQTHVSFLA